MATCPLRSHQLRELDLSRKREYFTAIHNFFFPRPDMTTSQGAFLTATVLDHFGDLGISGAALATCFRY